MVYMIYCQAIGGYYTGKKYIHQGFYYPCTTSAARRRNEAKIYKSKLTAERSAKALQSKCEGDFIVEAVQ